MSANGELFILELLAETASENGMLDTTKEQLKLPDSYYNIWNDRDIKNDTIQIEDCDTGEPLGELSFTGKVEYDDCGNIFNIVSITRNGLTKWCDTTSAKNDWLEYLIPILNDFKDGKKTLTKKDVDWLMTTLRAKVEFVENLISEEEYLTILNDMER